MPSYVTLTGDAIDYETPDRALEAFVARFSAAAIDPQVTEAELVALLYGPENPLLEQGILPGHAMVTAATLKNPLYHVLQDLLGRKREQTGTLNVAAALARYTLPVSMAAEKLGIHPSAVRQAIAARRLPAWKVGGQYLLDPTSVDAFRLERRGPPPQLHVCMGNAPGLSFRVKHPGELQDRESTPPQVRGTITDWHRVGVLFGRKADYRFLVIEPGGKEDEIAIPGFFLKGRFHIAERINNPAKATEAWQEFQAS